ncbi:MAG: hypothetical protein ABUT39_03490 [Acidobacteriota bacterium]
MRPTPARVLLAVLILSALTAAVLTSQFIFYLAALMAGFLLATSLSTIGLPLTKALNRLRGCVVEVRVWGAVPPLPPGATLVLTSVNVLGLGIHVFFQASGGGPIHLKVAQPTKAQVALNGAVIGSARYVQWEGKKLPFISGKPAVFVSLSDAAVRDSPASVA